MIDTAAQSYVNIPPQIIFGGINMDAQCKRCGVEKSVQEFDKLIADGPLEPWNLRRCKQCAHEDYEKRYADQRARAALNLASARWKKENPQAHAELARSWRAKNPDKVRAVNRLNYAVRKGDMTRQTCSVCGGLAQAHHDSYAKGDELKVRWLCQKHHKLWHMVIDDAVFDGSELDLRFEHFKQSFSANHF